MDRAEHVSRLKKMLQQLSESGNVESLVREPASSLEGGLESMLPAKTDEGLEIALRSVQKVARDQDLADAEIHALEAIVLPRERPVLFIQNDSFGTPPAPWEHFAATTIRSRLEPVILSVGRIELPGNLNIPYGGTGFVVGDELLMTNRHVAELFASGLGLRGLAFRAGQSAGCDFKQEFGSGDTDLVTVKEVVMIHPYWDMAVLRVKGLSSRRPPLRLSIAQPETLVNRDVAVIGYPAKDWRNDSELQDRIFQKTFNVKRLHPGKIRTREDIRSFDNVVSAMTHDSSTLGGNSGSAIVDVSTGEIIGLHFAGVYLKANYAVPTYELARDSRVVAAGLNFAGIIAHTDDWAAAWRLADAGESTAVPPASPPGGGSTTTAAPAAPGPGTWTISGTITIMAGAAPAETAINLVPSRSPADTGLEALKEPFVAGRLNTRKGYQPGFLQLDDGEDVPLPTLTVKGKKAASKLEDGSTELKYHKFSIVMHKDRRLAMFTAANVDWRNESRLIDGRKPTRRELTGLGDSDQEKWLTDPRIPQDHQLPDVFFTKDDGAWDKGHLVRRDDVCWGSSLNDIRKANGDTFHVTNCSPQTAEFNRSNKGDDNWGDLEVLVQKQSRAETLIIFSGPVLGESDPVFLGRDQHGEVRVQIPQKYWKIIVAKGESGPEAYGFVLEQDLSGVELEFAVPTDWQLHMERISKIEELLDGLVRLTWLKNHDQFDTVRGRNVEESISGPHDITEAADVPAAPRANVETAVDLTGAETAEGFLQGATFQNRPVKFSIVEERAIFEGDIDLGPISELSPMPEIGLESIGITGQKFRWPNRTIPYTIDPTLPNQQRVTDAIAHWEAKTQIRFVQRTNQSDYVTFQPGGGCSSSVGRRGGQQFVTLGSACTTGNATHEIGHTVGLWHEQSREDRDHFVTIDFSNIQSGMEHNFLQHISDGDDLGRYDYDSIMHYPANAFAIDPARPTIKTPNGEPIGQRVELSPGDIAGVALMYP